VRLALAGELVPDAVNVQGGQLAEQIKPLLPLAESLGSIACGLADDAVERVDVEVLGEVIEHDVRVLELSALKGVFQKLVHDPVSYVNAPVLAEQRGVEVALTTDKTSPDHRNLVRVRLTLTNGSSVSVAGTVTGAKNIGKVVEVDGFDVDVPVSENMVFFRYHDKPGVVGIVGQILGDAGVNIGGMQVSRDDTAHALIVLTVDSSVPSTVIDSIITKIGAHSGRFVDLV
jgi:D-3-phosphoglycerate dehydrogenase